MKKIELLLLMSLLLIISCKPKNNLIVENKVKEEVNYIPYYLKVYEADSLYLSNNFQRSYEILDSLFKIYEPKDTDSYDEYGIYLGSAVMSGNIDKNFEKKVSFGYSNFGFITARHKDWEKIIDTIEKVANLNKDKIDLLRQEYKNKINIKLRNELLSMYKDDQRVRTRYVNETELEIVDLKNRKKLENILDIYGYPSTALIGSNNSFEDFLSIDILFLHQNDNFKEKYLPMLLDNVKKGKCNPRDYALIYDRKMWESIDKQYFGSYISDEKKISPELLNPKKVDSLRKNIGLDNIFYNSWRLNKIRNN